MAFIHSPITPQQAACIVDLFKIVAPTKQDCYFGVDPKLEGKCNFIDGADNPQYGVVVNMIINRVPDTQFFAASDLLNDWFAQQAVLYSKVTFINKAPRPTSLIRVPSDWNYRMEKDLMEVSRKNPYQYLVDRMKFLFWDDPDMGARVNALVVPELV